MLHRTASFARALGLSTHQQQRVEALAHITAEAAQGMAHLDDYRSLGAIACDLQPRRIFEIGTYLGTTSNFLLELLPGVEMVSIAYVRTGFRLFSRWYNNSSLKVKEVGCRVTPANRSRFQQLLGDSHQLVAGDLLKRFGPFDLVFIDGDHTHRGVSLDTALALQIIAPNGGICWHDANPIDKYADVRRFLECDLPETALATTDHYTGGIAYWHASLAQRGVVPGQPSSTQRAA
jgi:predicted O-methyltransferase YrrM